MSIVRGANLTGANLTGADLWGVNLEGVNLEGAASDVAPIGWTAQNGILVKQAVRV